MSKGKCGCKAEAEASRAEIVVVQAEIKQDCCESKEGAAADCCARDDKVVNDAGARQMPRERGHCC